VFIDALAKLFAGRDWLRQEDAAPPRRATATLTDICATPSSSFS
jgi:hypothetical protein